LIGIHMSDRFNFNRLRAGLMSAVGRFCCKSRGFQPLGLRCSLLK
jgi:hypothetical protein